MGSQRVEEVVRDSRLENLTSKTRISDEGGVLGKKLNATAATWDMGSVVREGKGRRGRMRRSKLGVGRGGCERRRGSGEKRRIRERRG